jgi:hypothetical protein
MPLERMKHFQQAIILLGGVTILLSMAAVLRGVVVLTCRFLESKVHGPLTARQWMVNGY